MTEESEIISYLESKYQFQLSEKLGQGAFGTVYKAIDNTDEQECAIKILYKSNMSCSLIEGRLLQQLDHPHIVKFKRVGETKHAFVIIMELMKGGTIAQLIKQRKQNEQPFTDDEASTIMKCILSAVDYMHSQNILHRDLKPENILLADPNDLTSVKVADFGLGIQYSTEMTYRSFLQQCGTVLFMSPEQLKNQPYSKPVDLWSCGIIMYMILSMGRHPFNYNYEIETKEQYIKIITSCSQKIENWPNCSNLAIDLITRLTNFSPSNRYNAGKSLNHPWITRRLNDQIPLSFDENRQIFQSKNTFMNVVLSIMIVKFLKQRATKKQLKKIHIRKNYSTSTSVVNKEPAEAPSPLIYSGNRSRLLKTNGIIALYQNTYHDQEEEMSNSPQQSVVSQQFQQILNSPNTNKREFMIKKLDNCYHSQSPQPSNQKGTTKQLLAPSYFKVNNSLPTNQQKTNTNTQILNQSKQTALSGQLLNNSNNDISKKNQVVEFRQNNQNQNGDFQKQNYVKKEQTQIRIVPSTSQNQNRAKQDNFLPLCFKLPLDNNHHINFDTLNNSTQSTSKPQSQVNTPNSQSNHSNSNQLNQGTFTFQSYLGQSNTNTNRNQNRTLQTQNTSSTFQNKQRQLRVKQSDSLSYQKEQNDSNELNKRNNTAKTKFSQKRLSEMQAQYRTQYNSSNNSFNPVNISINKNTHFDQTKIPNQSNNSKQSRKYSFQVPKTTTQKPPYKNDFNLLNLEEIFQIKKQPKSLRILNTQHDTKSNNE
ncbi:Serine/Threonine kinase domain protein (macronuclear) [Tetrahymena thermophila SB210]|uniref:Serine/Threonine kinase domain protein n=1 Tax=Tetrahymena thermophila (strain SB210) TaxID=312017 RepID=Q233F7_TETTS|nr:Serine/Threonine kinase domain protein [Tetrahymena thermophila SB210]EAR91623.3 Serine/Threonine kinase domain protein [Tetrahymena thermophila SB210]|eukprot:XP_001011868.3 Serine/Threonine kinase domain protein [Tetrahymena thermophila SB210]